MLPGFKASIGDLEGGKELSSTTKRRVGVAEINTPDEKNGEY